MEPARWAHYFRTEDVRGEGCRSAAVETEPTFAAAAAEVAAPEAVATEAEAEAAGEGTTATAGAAVGAADPRALFGRVHASHASAAFRMPGDTFSTTRAQPAGLSAYAAAGEGRGGHRQQGLSASCLDTRSPSGGRGVLYEHNSPEIMECESHSMPASGTVSNRPAGPMFSGQKFSVEKAAKTSRPKQRQKRERERQPSSGGVEGFTRATRVWHRLCPFLSKRDLGRRLLPSR